METTFVLWAFEAVLSGLLCLVLAGAFWKKPELRPKRPLWHLFLCLGVFSLGFWVWAGAGLYEFYYSHALGGQPPAVLALPWVLLCFLFLGLAHRGGVLAGGGGMVAISLVFLSLLAWGGLLGRGGGLFRLSPWLGLLALSVLFLGLPGWEGWGREGRLLQLALVGVAVASLTGQLLENSPYWGPLQPASLLLSLLVLARLIEEVTDDLFIRFFVRLNLTFILLAGFIILVVADVQKQEYLRFAEREAADLMEFLRGHVMYFHDQGQSPRQVLDNPSIRRRVISDFGRIPSLRAVALQVNGDSLRLEIDENGVIRRALESDLPPRKWIEEPHRIEGVMLRLYRPIFSGGEVVGGVELRESLREMHHSLIRQIAIIFGAFTASVLLGAVLVGIIVAAADSTIRKQYQELREAHEKLLQAEKLAALGELAGGVAHEVNNPLGIIIARLDYLLESARSGGMAEVEADLLMIQRQAQRAAKIVSDLLDFARSRPLDRQGMDLNELLRETLELLQPQFKKKQLELSLELAPLPQVEVDRNRLQQVLLNLLQNAVEACGPRGKVRVTSHLLKGEGRVEVVVEDDGPGIRPSHLSKLFDPFFTTKKSGTGLGLAVSYRIIRDHGGELTAGNRPGGGACFRLTLPRAEGT